MLEGSSELAKAWLPLGRPFLERRARDLFALLQAFRGSRYSEKKGRSWYCKEKGGESLPRCGQEGEAVWRVLQAICIKNCMSLFTFRGASFPPEDSCWSHAPVPGLFSWEWKAWACAHADRGPVDP